MSGINEDAIRMPRAVNRMTGVEMAPKVRPDRSLPEGMGATAPPVPDGFEAKWQHMDGTYCSEHEMTDPADPIGGWYWCETHKEMTHLNPKWEGYNA